MFDMSKPESAGKPQTQILEQVAELEPTAVTEEFTMQIGETVQPQEVTLDVSKSEISVKPETQILEQATELKPETITQEVVVEKSESVKVEVVPVETTEAGVTQVETQSLTIITDHET